MKYIIIFERIITITMEGHDHSCEIHYIYKKVREQQQEIDKLSQESTSLLSQIKREIVEIDQNNPQKFNKYTQIYQENEKRIQNMKVYKQQLKKQTIKLQNRVHRTNTIKKFGLLGYFFAFMLKTVEKHAIGSTHEQIISFMLFLFIGTVILLVDWLIQGIDKFIINENSYIFFLLFVFFSYFVVFGVMRLFWRNDQEIYCNSPRRSKNEDHHPGWILNP